MPFDITNITKASSKADLEELNRYFENKQPQEILKWALDSYTHRIALACSLSAEDTVLLHMMHEINKKPRVFVLDTGRLHEESYETLNRCRTHYHIPIEIYFPEATRVEHLVREKGPFSFYESLENRKECCFIRKVEPLKRALEGLDAWITGLRREQSSYREHIPIFEMDDEKKGNLKISPLVNWSWSQILDYAKQNQVPLNSLHKKGYPSIGCQPCTRAVQKDQSLREGRWWWEEDDGKECGLHTIGQK